jgi:hypothetical protein
MCLETTRTRYGESAWRRVIRGPAVSAMKGSPGAPRGRFCRIRCLDAAMLRERARDPSIRCRSVTEKVVEPLTHCMDHVTRRRRQRDGPVLRSVQAYRRKTGSEALGAVLPPDPDEERSTWVLGQRPPFSSTGTRSVCRCIRLTDASTMAWRSLQSVSALSRPAEVNAGQGQGAATARHHGTVRESRPQNKFPRE